jgi:hypothetical protein
MIWAQERDHLTLALRNAPISERIQAYRRFEKRTLNEARTAFEKLEMRRRATESMLMAAMEGPWKGFSPYLRRMERLGYSSMDCRMLVFAWAARATKSSAAGRRKTAALIAEFERRLRGRKLHPAYREQINIALARARRFAGLDTGGEG